MASRNHNSYSTQLLQLFLSFMLAEVIISSNVAEEEILSKETFFERCRTASPGLRTGLTCEQLWAIFQRVFECPSSDCTPITDDSAYKEFVEQIPPTTPANRTLFYSGGTKVAAYNIGKKCIDKLTIQMTFLGQLFDDLKWCCVRNGSVDTQCSADDSCTSVTLNKFWTQASELFAKNASMHTAVILNGSGSAPPYREDSIFTTTEVPSLTSSVISMTAILVYENDQVKKRWTCSSPDSRLPDLHVALARKNIQYNCTDDYWYSSEQCSSANSLSMAIWMLSLILVIQKIIST